MNNKLKIILAGCCLLAGSTSVNGQNQTVSLDSCYVLAKQNYPLVKQHELIDKSREFSIQNIVKGYLPRVNINGQATYQSDVTQLPKSIPGAPVLSKDQYKLYAEVSQPVYDGGVIREQKKLQEANSVAEEQKLEVDLYQIKDRINQLYFGILLIDEQLKQNILMQKDIQLGLNKTNALIANGTALKSNGDILKAELLKSMQKNIELKSDRKAFTDMLALFIKRPLDETSVFIKPPTINSSEEIKRPELLFYDYQKKILDAQNNLITAKNRPKVSLFAQGGFGKPAFNIFNNNFSPYYIGGLRLSVPLTGFYTLKNERALIHINMQKVEVQKEVFLFNTRYALQQQNAQISKLQEILKTDQEIIPLRTKIKEAALAQMENGVINSSDYLREINAEDNAKQNELLHQIQLLMAEYTVQTTTGNQG